MFVYWIKNNKGGGMGSWETREEAEKAIKFMVKEGNDLDWKVEECEAMACPLCGRIERKDMIEGLGMCIGCDEAQYDARQERPEPEE